MIRYALKCAEGHQFDSWFQSAEAFDTLSARGLVACAECGGTDVQKAIMAPRVSAERAGEPEAAEPRAPEGAGALTEAKDPREEMLKAMRAHVEANSTYVGGNFAREARAMHLGDVPDKPIHGEANASEAKALIEDGVPILPLPGPPRNKTN